MDPNDDIEFVDSGMGSLASSKGDTPESKSELETADTEPAGQIVRHSGGDAQTKLEYDDEPDETISERIWGLTEMFPERLRCTTHSITTNSWEAFKVVYGFTRSVSWVIASSSVILFAPIIFEVERAQMEEMQRTQQKQVLFGPPAGNLTATMPPLQR